MATSSATPERSRGWLYRPSTDLLLGAGLGYIATIPVLMWFGGAAESSLWAALGVLLAHFISGPHYGATILRVYERRADRRKYAIFSVWATLVLCALFVAGLHYTLVGSLLVTLYATWSPWHFSGQNYGLALMFLGRRGLAVDPLTKRLLYASFCLSFALAFLVMHGVHSTLTYASVPISEAGVFRFLSIGLPDDVLRIALPATALAYVGSLAGAAVRLLRHGSARDLAPAACLVLTQALWFTLPALAPSLVGRNVDGLAFTAVWISAAHATQYLWVTSYYARKEDPGYRLGRYLWRTLLAGSLVTIFPAVIFAPRLLGTLPWDMGLAILLIAVANLHHFVLDGAIWKLRDHRVGRLLLREDPPEPGPLPEASGRSWFRPAVALLGGVSLLVAGIDAWEREVGVNRSGGDVRRILLAAERLAWIGRDAPSLHIQLGDLMLRRRQPGDAIARYRRSLELFPTAEAHTGLARVYASQARWPQALESLGAALALDPGYAPAWVHSGRAWLALERPDRAREALEQARALAPRNPDIRRNLEQLEAVAGRHPQTPGGS